MPSELFFEVFPFNIVFNRGLRIINIGSGIQNVMPELEGLVLSDPFTLIRPLMDFTWDAVHCSAANYCSLLTRPSQHQTSSNLKPVLLPRAQIIMHANNVFEMVALYEVGQFDEFRRQLNINKKSKDMQNGARPLIALYMKSPYLRRVGRETRRDAARRDRSNECRSPRSTRALSPPGSCDSRAAH